MCATSLGPLGAMIKFVHPFTKIVAGPTGSGKSTYCIQFLENLDTVCTETDFAGGIYWCYSEETAIPVKQLERLGKRVLQHKGVPDTSVLNTGGLPALLILDDLQDTAYSQNVSTLFTRGSHHRNISVILITQNLFHKGSHARDISLNAKYIVLLKNVRDKTQFQFLARQVYPEDCTSLFNAYLDATKEGHGYLVLDLSQTGDDRLRFRTNIFPVNNTILPPIVYAPIGNETGTVEL